MSYHVMSLYVLGQAQGFEVEGNVDCIISDNPLEASFVIRNYITEALSALRSTQPGIPWIFHVTLDVEQSEPSLPGIGRWKVWLGNQGILPAIRWKKSPMVPLTLETSDEDPTATGLPYSSESPNKPSD